LQRIREWASRGSTSTYGGLGISMLIASLCIVPTLTAYEVLDHWLAATLVVLFLLLSAPLLHAAFKRLALQPPARQYEVCAAGLGMWCAMLAIAAGLIVIAEIRGGDLPHVASEAPTPHEQVLDFVARWTGVVPDRAAKTATLVQVSGIVAALGACLFCLRRIQRFRPPTQGEPASPASRTRQVSGETFNVRIFWNGLLFRVAQALIYTLVAFLWIWGSAQKLENGDVTRHPPYDHYWYVPILALMIGLFVTTFESIVAGAAERMAGAARAQVGQTGGGDGRGQSGRQRSTMPPNRPAAGGHTRRPPRPRPPRRPPTRRPPPTDDGSHV
jgi:hypothetical protein